MPASSHQQACEANREIFLRLYKAHAAMIYGIVSRCVSDEATIVAVLKDTFTDLVHRGRQAVSEPEVIQQTFRSIASIVGHARATGILNDYMSRSRQAQKASEA